MDETRGPRMFVRFKHPITNAALIRGQVSASVQRRIKMPCICSAVVYVGVQAKSDEASTITSARNCDESSISNSLVCSCFIHTKHSISDILLQQELQRQAGRLSTKHERLSLRTTLDDTTCLINYYCHLPNIFQRVLIINS